MNLNVTVCELADEPERLEADWQALAAHVRAAGSDLVLLPEMAFAGWFARERPFDAAWEAAVAAHDAWLARLPELGAACVLGSRPVNTSRGRRNQAFIWEQGAGVRTAHLKRYLPDEPGFWEASWYGRGNGEFQVYSAGPARLGFMICTDLWFLEHARALGRAGAQLVATPRATERATVEKWLVGGRAAAVVAGAFSLSSNRVSRAATFAPMGGQGWIVDPDGVVLGVTSPEQPFLTVSLSLAQADAARATYPRYVAD